MSVLNGPLYRIARFGLRLVAKALFSLSAEGVDRLPPTGPAVLAPNHASWLDPVILPLVLPRKPAFLAMEELWRMPGISVVMRVYGPYAIPIRRQSVDITALKRALDVLHRGALLIVFPEGGISPDGSLRRFHLGPALLAARSGAPLVPVAIKGTREALPLGHVIPRPHPIIVRIGNPIHVGDDRRETLRWASLEAATQIKLLLEGS